MSENKQIYSNNLDKTMVPYDASILSAYIDDYNEENWRDMVI